MPCAVNSLYVVFPGACPLMCRAPMPAPDCCQDTVLASSWSVSPSTYFSVSTSGQLLVGATTVLDWDYGTRTYSSITVFARDSVSQLTSTVFSVSVTDV